MLPFSGLRALHGNIAIYGAILCVQAKVAFPSSFWMETISGARNSLAQRLQYYTISALQCKETCVYNDGWIWWCCLFFLLLRLNVFTVKIREYLSKHLSKLGILAAMLCCGVHFYGMNYIHHDQQNINDGISS